MAEVVNMPKLGFDMAEGTLVRWVVHEGENIQKGAILAEIETDKATVEVESSFEGVVARHLVKEGDIVPVSTPIAVIAAPGEKVEETTAASGAGEQGGKGAEVPTASVAATPGGAEEKGSKEAQAPAASATAAPAPTPVSPELADLPGGVKASPLARRIAEEQGLDLTRVQGSGPGGRITKKDVEAQAVAAAGTAAAPAPSAAPTPVAAPAMPLAPAPADQVVPLNRLRAAIGRRMVEAKQQVPHFYVTHEYDMAALLELRRQVNELLPDDEKTSVNDYILKAAALCLREFPNLNASLNGYEIVRHGAVNMGVAVAVENGLLTVVCRDADRKGIRQISAEVKVMAARAREGKVRPDDIEGSTFSVSNLGMFDVEHFIAIINPPEAAILALGSAREVPVVKNGQVVPGQRMKATISVDHRVSDGAEAARYLQALAKYIEQPLRLMV